MIKNNHAFNSQFSLDAGYALVGVDSTSGISKLTLRATLACVKHWGARLEGTIATDPNYSGLFAGIGCHF